MPAAILYVDDESPLRRAAQAWLGHKGVRVVTARSVEGAVECLATDQIDGVFCDLWLADGSGFKLFAHIEEQHQELAARIVFITGDIVPAETTATQLAMIGRPVLFKPFDLSELDRWVGRWRAPAAPPAPDFTSGLALGDSTPRDSTPEARA